MKDYNMALKFCSELEKELENRTGNTFLALPFIKEDIDPSIGIIVAKDCTIVFEAKNVVRKDLTERFAMVQKQVNEAVDTFIINGKSIAA